MSDLRLKPATVGNDTLDAGYAVFPHETVCLVLSIGCCPQIGNAVVQPIAINMIDDDRNRLAVDVKPSKPVDEIMRCGAA